MQAYVRGLLARKQTRSLREQKAATNIQTAWRRYKMRQQYNLVLHNITAVQVCMQGCPFCRPDFLWGPLPHLATFARIHNADAAC